MKAVAVIALFTISTLLAILATSSCASAQDATSYVTPAAPFPGSGGAMAVMGSVAGFVVDADGNPVSDAVVTLRQDGQIVNPSPVRTGNPQISGLYSVGEASDEPMGFFQFSRVYPGEYTVTADRDGFNGTAAVYVSNDTVHHFSSLADMLESYNDTVMANITLNGYHAPVLSGEQLSSAGAITGLVLDGEGDIIGYVDVNVSLWQNGQMVSRPDNPQRPDFSGSNPRGFLFGHLPPGRYQVLANVTDILWDTHLANVTVDVGNGTTVANITFEDYLNRDQPVPGASFTDALLGALSICMAALYCRSRKTPPGDI